MIVRTAVMVAFLLAAASPVFGPGGLALAQDDSLRLLDLNYLESSRTSRLVVRASLPFTHNAYDESESVLVVEMEMADVRDVSPEIVIGSRAVERILVSNDASRGKTLIRIHHNNQQWDITPKGRRLFIDFSGSERGSARSVRRPNVNIDGGSAQQIRNEDPGVQTSGSTDSDSARNMGRQQRAALNYRLDTPYVYDLSGIRVFNNKNASGVLISLSREASRELYRIVPVGSPPRFVLDLHGARNMLAQKNADGVPDLFSAVRSAQFAMDPYPISRIVLDLTSSEEPQVVERGNSLRIVFTRSDAESQQQLAQAEPTAEEGASQGAGESRPESADSDTGSIDESGSQAAEQQYEPAEARPESSSLIEERLAADTNPEPADESVELFTEQFPERYSAEIPQPAMPVVGRPQETEEQELPYAQEPETTVISGVDFQTREITSGERRYRGKRISLQFETIPLRALIGLLGEMTSKNFIVDPSVPQVTVSISLRELPWDQALDIILAHHGLAKIEEGNVIRVATRARLTQEAEEQREMLLQQALAVPVRQVTRPINYAKANDLAALLRRNLSSKGEVVVDARTNTVVISDIPSKVDEHLALVEALDIPTRQVIVEARIVETTRDFIYEFGMQYGFRNSYYTAEYGGSTGLIFPNQMSLSGNMVPDDGYATAPMAVNLPSPNPNTSILGTFSNISGSFILDAILTAAESERKVRVLSRPRISAQNNSQAVIMSGLEVPYQVIQNNTVSIRYREAVLKLTVTPHITSDGTVIMDVVVDKNSLGVQTPMGFAIQKRQATSTVLVKDGGVAVIGGVLEVSDNLTEERVPFLSRIPLIGRLFRNELQRVQNTELLIFISPKIIS